MMLEAQSLEVSLTASDIQRSVDWYRDVIGFAVDREYAREGKLFAVSLKAGSVKILITQDDGAKGTDRVKGEGFAFQIVTTHDVDEIAKRITVAGGELAAPPVTNPWGIRAVRLRDPDGFRFVISNRPPQ